MKKLLLVFAALAAMAACTPSLPYVTLSAPESFNSENVAFLTISLSGAAETEVQVLLSGTPADKLTFENKITIPAGSRGERVMVTVDPVGIEEGAVITIGIQDVIGANVGNPGIVSLTLQTYGGGVNSGDSGDGNGGGNNGGNDGNVTLVSTWSAALNGDPYTEEGEDWVDLTMSTSGIKYYGVEALFAGELEEYYKDVAGLIASWDEYIADYLTNGYTVTDVLFADGEYTYIDYPGAGAAQIYIVEFDATGKTTGRYGVSSVVFPEYEGGSGGGGSDITATLVSSWKAEMDGDPYTDEYGDWIDLKMTTTGIKYYAVGGITDDVFDAYYDGIEDLIQDYDAYIAGELEDGYTVSQLLFADGEYTYIEYPGEGAGKIYIIEFDASGKATGRYGATAATFPEFEGGGSGGGGELEWEKTIVGVPATFTKNTSLGVEYQGRYTDGDDTGDLFSATGTGESMWAIDVFAPNAFDGDVHAYAADLAAYIEQSLADLVEEYGADMVSYIYEDLADFLAYEVLGTYEGEPFLFDTYENGTYDALVLTFTADGDFTGEYNLVKVTVDGHEYVEPAGAPAHITRASRHNFSIGKGLENLVRARSLHAAHTKVAARRLAPGHTVISSVAEKSAKKSNKICRLK